MSDGRNGCLSHQPRNCQRRSQHDAHNWALMKGDTIVDIYVCSGIDLPELIKRYAETRRADVVPETREIEHAKVQAMRDQLAQTRERAAQDRRTAAMEAASLRFANPNDNPSTAMVIATARMIEQYLAGEDGGIALTPQQVKRVRQLLSALLPDDADLVGLPDELKSEAP